MHTRLRMFLLCSLLACAAAAQAAGPAISPEGAAPAVREAAPASTVKSFDKAWGDPRDAAAAAQSAAHYLRALQSDVTEDNAGNGNPDIDPEDAGWDWTSLSFSHSAGASAVNCYGVTVLGVYQAYRLSNDPALFTVMKDAADRIVAVGPASIRYAGDITFLLDFAALPGVASPATYTAAAKAIWDYRLANYGDHTAAGFARFLRDGRHGQGYDNGVIPWDVSHYVEAVARLDAAFPGQGYDAAADAMAEVLWQDSFALSPGYFQPNGVNKGFDPSWSNTRYWWYSLGVSGLIKAFSTAGVHAADLPLLQSLLLDCQYADGAFSDQYGNDPAYNFRDFQSSAYAVSTCARFLPASAATQAAVHAGAYWLAYYQDPSGGWLWSDGSHTPEVGGECADALAAAATTSYVALGTTVSGPDPVACGATKVVTVRFDRSAATPGLRGYEVTFRVTGAAVSFGAGDIADAGSLAGLGLHYFQPVHNADGTWTVNDAVLGATPGLLADGDLFRVSLATIGDGPVAFDLVSYKLRDPVNAPILASLSGAGFTVDCTAPAAVTGITAAPAHNKVNVSWTHNGSDTVTYEVYRGLMYYGSLGLSAYPEYDDLPGVIPTRPANRAAAAAVGEWELAGTVGVGTTSFVDDGPFVGGRGIYYYEVFAIDAAANAGPTAAANDRATNYWLGDVWGGDNVHPVPNGLVESFDVNRLGAAFGRNESMPGYDNVVDVGPTDDWSGVGIPTTDSVINFEDLMIFAMNFGQVTPAKVGAGSTGAVTLAWRDLGDGRWSLDLVDGFGLQGLRVSADLAVGAVTAGELVARDSQAFMVNTGTRLDANLAVLGAGRAFGSAGSLLVVATGADMATARVTIDARGTDNSRLETSFSRTSGGQAPGVFRLNGNYPNPFNPKTTISFSLPAAQQVKLEVYSLDGRKVATLLDESRGVGTHEVTWMGLDDAGQPVASGSYMCRLEAGAYTQVTKMTLMK